MQVHGVMILYYEEKYNQKIINLCQILVIFLLLEKKIEKGRERRFIYLHILKYVTCFQY